jgi:hypothetical protein
LFGVDHVVGNWLSQEII